MSAGYYPLFFGSACLPNRQFIVMGGEYNACTKDWTARGALYNPFTNKWSTMNAPTGWTTIGDAQSVVLNSGKFMLANCCTTDEAILTFGTKTWTATGTGKPDINDEEGWTLLPICKLLQLDAHILQT